MNVAVVGASNKQHRYSYQALMLLKSKGHAVFPVHPRLEEIEGLKVYRSLKDISVPLDTVTLYVSSDISTKLAHEILSQKPRRIIFNPGAENPLLEQKARQQGIETIPACTLVLLHTNQF